MSQDSNPDVPKPGGPDPGGRSLDRRGFLGAAAGVVGAATVATSPFAWAAASKSSADCAETTAAIPKARRGAIHFSFPATVWNSTALFLDFITLMKTLNCNAWEFAGNYPTVGPGITGNSAPAAGSRSAATPRRTASASSARMTARSRPVRGDSAARSRR